METENYRRYLDKLDHDQLQEEYMMPVLLGYVSDVFPASSATPQQVGKQGTFKLWSSVAFILSLLTMMLVTEQAHADDGEPMTPILENAGLAIDDGTCYAVDVSEGTLVSWYERDALLSYGYVGDPRDSAEMLYSPACFDSPEYIVYASYEVSGQDVISSPTGDVVTEQDGTDTHIGYADGSAETIPTPLNEDHTDNLRDSLRKGCVASDLFEDYSCKAPSVTQQGTYAEDGSYISDPATYYSPAPMVSDDGWIVLVSQQGKPGGCKVFIDSTSKDPAQSIAGQYLKQGYNATAVHYTDALNSKLPDC